MSGLPRPPVDEVILSLRARLTDKNINSKEKYRLEDRISRLQGQEGGYSEGELDLPRAKVDRRL